MRSARLFPALLTAALAAAAAAAAHAEEKPLWELGLGAGFLAFNDYRGSATTHVYPVPVPYFVYRGTFLKSDRDGLRGLFLNQTRVELSLSVNATTPVHNDSARHGMPDLRPTLELGPELDVHLWRSADERCKLDLRLPARAAFTIEAAPHLVGMFIAPNVSLDIAQFRGEHGWKLGLLGGPLFANQRYDNYFYTVAPQYASAGRPAFAAQGGYAGAQVLAALTRRYPRWWIGAYVRHDTLGGASFAASPLVKRDSYWSAGLGVAWLIRQSTQLVESPE
jgi:outer membrane scaffolding protein for murein synthesis (MipA/OmpV family)